MSTIGNACKQGLAHLGAAGVVQTDEQDVQRVISFQASGIRGELRVRRKRTPTLSIDTHQFN